MLTPEDIQKLTEAQIEAQKDSFYTKSEMDEKFSSLQTSVDTIKPLYVSSRPPSRDPGF